MHQWGIDGSCTGAQDRSCGGDCDNQVMPADAAAMQHAVTAKKHMVCLGLSAAGKQCSVW
jgi:hypothetical protein